MHKDVTQYCLRKCLKGKLRKHYITKYHVWCFDWCLFLSVFDTYLSLLVLEIVPFWIKLPFLYRHGYHLNFYLVVSKMSSVLTWQPPADNDVCFRLVKEYYMYICWKIKFLLLLLILILILLILILLFVIAKSYQHHIMTQISAPFYGQTLR